MNVKVREANKGLDSTNTVAQVWPLIYLYEKEFRLLLHVMETNLSLSSNWSYVADFLAFQGVYNWTFTNIGIASKSNADLLFIRMKLAKNTNFNI